MQHLFLSIVGCLTEPCHFTTVLPFPRIPTSEDAIIDMERHFYKSRRIFFTGFTSAWVLALVCNWSFFPITWMTLGNVLPAAMIVLGIIAIMTANRGFHAVYAVIALIAIALNVLSEGAWTLNTFIE